MAELPSVLTVKTFDGEVIPPDQVATFTIEEEEDEEFEAVLRALIEHRSAFPALSAIVFGCDALPALEGIEDDALRTLFGSVECVELGSYEEITADFAAWCERGLFAEAQGLQVNHSKMKDAGVTAFLDAGPYPSLKSLDLRYNKIRKAGTAALAATEALPALVELKLASNGLGAAGVKALLQDGGLAAVQSFTALDLSNTKPGASLPLLLSGKALPNLESLMLTHNSTKPELWTKGLAGMRRPKLRRLDVSVGIDAHDERLRSDPFGGAELPSLEWLGTASTFTRAAALSLAKSPNLPALETLSVATEGDPTRDDEEIAV
ncbi:MAG: hypothetical protein NXI35_27590 [bacterium]|nr:hypothetical protein [bacterium]